MTLETLSRIADSLGFGLKITFPKEPGVVVA